MKRNLQLFAVGVVLLMAGCSSEKQGFTTFTTKIDMTGSAAYGADQLNTNFMFSKDNGATYVQFPVLKLGDKYMVELDDVAKGVILNGDACAGLHWEGSVPAPSDTTADTPTFVFSANNTLKVKVLDIAYTSFKPATWAGAWTGVEGPLSLNGVPQGNGSTDALTMTQDAVNPNKYVLGNFFGDGATATVAIIFNTSTSLSDQTISMAAQTVTADPTPNTASGSGTYDQCHGTFTLAVTYVQPAFGGTFTWTYQIHR